MESRASLIDLIKNKTLHDLQAQLAQLAGSLTVIGSPMGFARKVGTNPLMPEAMPEMTLSLPSINPSMMPAPCARWRTLNWRPKSWDR